MKVVHYLNQFFAGLGGEQAAGTPPRRLDGAVGPGLLLGLPVAATLTCGDDFFGEHEDAALAELLRLLAAEKADVLVLGPAFGSGRYGYACGTLAREAARLGVPAVFGLHDENPGVTAAEGEAYIVPTSTGVGGMRDALDRMAGLARRLAAGEDLGPPEAEGYLPRGLRRNELAEKTAGARALELLLAKLAGETRTEVAAAVDAVVPPPPVAVGSARLALITEAGCVPLGNPDRFPSVRASFWARYPLDGVETLAPGAYESVHGGFDATHANADPNRLVPVDVVRTLEREGRVGKLHDFFYVTMGNGTPVASSTRIGSEIAAELAEAGVEAVLLSGT